MSWSITMLSSLMCSLGLILHCGELLVQCVNMISEYAVGVG
ncbi:hypothetical protein PF007_g23853 [Phytophthora fragariae]|uniref:Uncharacterized protein n=1 Tax=Phytophthora fragariae TaxID=53985 RepID=A0A6A3QKX3_9STRA|nr:hypothetical protein PF009_g24579 [Phytophthora fragariae]KAE9078455.1 hypothetical protein PF007_g23853 [Phytophthora fragariae]